jgi:hypothetical protein
LSRPVVFTGGKNQLDAGWLKQAGARQPDGEAVGILVAPLALLNPRRSSEFTRQDYFDVFGMF